MKNLFLLLVLIFASGELLCFDPEFKITQEDVAFFEGVKKAIKETDKEWLANRIHFPICIMRNGTKVTIRNPKDFMKNYDLVFDSEVIEKIEKQDSSALFVNWEGRMAGNGALWFDLVGSNYLIVAVNGKNRVVCVRERTKIQEPN